MAIYGIYIYAYIICYFIWYILAIGKTWQRCSLPKALTESFVSRPIGWSTGNPKRKSAGLFGILMRHSQAVLIGPFFFNTKKHDLLWESHVNLKKGWNSMKFYSIPSISDKVGYGLLGFVTWFSIVESCTKLKGSSDCTWLTLHLCCKFQACRIQSQCCTPCARHVF
jgi:hypothetical protein